MVYFYQSFLYKKYVRASAYMAEMLSIGTRRIFRRD